MKTLRNHYWNPQQFEHDFILAFLSKLGGQNPQKKMQSQILQKCYIQFTFPDEVNCFGQITTSPSLNFSQDGVKNTSDLTHSISLWVLHFLLFTNSPNRYLLNS